MICVCGGILDWKKSVEYEDGDIVDIYRCDNCSKSIERLATGSSFDELRQIDTEQKQKDQNG
jgi:hypothetical protein